MKRPLNAYDRWVRKQSPNKRALIRTYEGVLGVSEEARRACMVLPRQRSADMSDPILQRATDHVEQLSQDVEKARRGIHTLLGHLVHREAKKVEEAENAKQAKDDVTA